MVYKRLERFLIQLDKVDSTNTYAADLIKTTNVSSGTVVLTNEQLSGKGQRSNVWTTEPGKNLTMSLIFFPNLIPSKSFYLNVATSLAVRKTLEDLKIDAEIKWPNDILVKGKKICGILIENQISSSKVASSVLGIGLNVNQMDFTKIANRATSIANEINHEVEINEVFDQLYGYLDFYLNLLCESNFDLLKKHYYKYLHRINLEAEYEDESGKFSGTIVGISEAGLLEIEKSTGKKHYDIKEISYC